MVHFFDAYTHSFHTGETADLEALSGEGCGFCERAYQRASQIHEAGGRLEAGEFVIVEVEINERPGTPWTNAQAQVEQAPIEVYDADDTLLRVDEGGQWTLSMALSYIEDEGWKVFEAMTLDS